MHPGARGTYLMKTNKVRRFWREDFKTKLLFGITSKLRCCFDSTHSRKKAAYISGFVSRNEPAKRDSSTAILFLFGKQLTCNKCSLFIKTIMQFVAKCQHGGSSWVFVVFQWNKREIKSMGCKGFSSCTIDRKAKKQRTWTNHSCRKPSPFRRGELKTCSGGSISCFFNEIVGFISWGH